MSYSILIHEDTVSSNDQYLLVRHLVASAPRGTIVVRTKSGQSVLMRHPVVATSAAGIYLAYKGDIVYADDIEFVEAYDPHPDYNPEGV
jgi:hypothetical protein